MNSSRIPADMLHNYVVRLLESYEVSAEQSQIVADVLIWSELVGRYNHGVIRLPIHLDKVEKRLINPACQVKFSRQSSSIEILDGDNGFGHYVSTVGMQRAIALAKREGAGIVGVKNSNFFGAGAYFVNLAALKGMIGIAFSNSFPKVAPFGGIKSVFGTNPMAFGCPLGDSRQPLMIDMATSALAGSTIREHIRRNKDLPEGLVADDDGQPITDPNLANSGNLLPMGGPKGYGLSLMIEILAGIITGAGFSSGVGSLYKDFERKANNGHFIMALNIEHFIPMEIYKERMEALVSLIKESNHMDEVLLPGETRWKCYEENSSKGIKVESSVINSLNKVSLKQGINPPWNV